MSRTTKKAFVRDYSKPITLNLQGTEGFRTYLKIITTLPTKYDAKVEAEKAAAILREQGLRV